MCSRLSVSVNCTRSPTAKSAGPCFVANRTSGPASSPRSPPDLAQVYVQLRDLGIRVGKHEPACLGVGRRVRGPARHQRGPRRVLIRCPGDRAVAVERRDRRIEPALGQIARRLPLPVHPLARHFGDLRRAMPGAQFGEQPAALDAAKLTIVAGQHHLGPGPLRLR